MKKTATFPKVDCHVAKHSYLYPRNNHLNVGPNHVQVEVNHLYGGTNGVEDELNRIQTVPNGVMPTAMISHANPIVFMLTMIVGRRQTIDSHKMTGIT